MAASSHRLEKFPTTPLAQRILPLHYDDNVAKPTTGRSKKRISVVLLLIFGTWVLFKTCYFFHGYRRHILFTPAAPNIWPIPPGINLGRCVQWPTEHDLPPTLDIITLNAPQSTTESFELPISSELLLFLSRGHLSNGVINIIQSAETSNITKVDVTASYWHTHELEHSKVCLIERNEGEAGVGIFTTWWSKEPHRSHIQFEVTVHLPKISGSSPFPIKGLQTDMPLFKHAVGDLEGKIDFRTFIIKTANAPIAIQSLYAETANIDTVNSFIEGTFNTSSSLSLVTANSHINVHVGLLNAGGEDSTSVRMSTSNAPIDAVISLTSSEVSGGKYLVTAATSLSKIEIAFPEAPVDSSLYLDADTALGPAIIKLHETYEGNFTLESSLHHPSVILDDRVEDPAGKQRNRSVTFQEVGSFYVEGAVSWSKESKLSGHVHAKTSLAAVSLLL